MTGIESNVPRCIAGTHRKPRAQGAAGPVEQGMEVLTEEGTEGARRGVLIASVWTRGHHQFPGNPIFRHAVAGEEGNGVPLGHEGTRETQTKETRERDAR